MLISILIPVFNEESSIKEILTKIMTKASDEFADMVFAIQKEVEKLEKDVSRTVSRKKVEKAGFFWSDYNS